MFANERKVKTIKAKEKRFDKSQYDANYKKQKTKRIPLELNREHDADIINHLERISNRNGYIKRLIREDMEKSE